MGENKSMLLCKKKLVHIPLKFLIAIIIVLTLVHLLVMLTPNIKLLLIIKVITSFITVFILPGALLHLLCYKAGNHIKIISFLVESFILSTFIDVIYIISFFGLNIPINKISFSLYLITLVSSILLLINYRKKSILIEIEKEDLFIVCMAFISQVILIIILTNLPHWMTLDETAYLTYSRRILLGDTYPPTLMGSGEFFRSNIYDFLQGRFFWIFLISAFLASTGIEASYASFLNIMFLTMLALSTSLMLSTNFLKQKYLRLIIFLFVFTNPILLNFSDFVLADLPFSFYTLVSMLIYIRSFQRSEKNLQINMKLVILSFTMFIVAYLTKPNPLPALVMYIGLIIYLIWYKIYKCNRKYRYLLYVLLLPLLTYEIVIDIPFVICAYLLKMNFGGPTEQYVIFSLLEPLILLFTQVPWSPNIIMNYSLLDLIERFYTLISPYTLSPIISATSMLFICVPFMKGLRNRMQIEMNVLSLILLLNLSLFYIYSLSQIQVPWALSEISRQSLYNIAPLIATSLSILYDIFIHRFFKSAKFVIGFLILLYILNHSIIWMKGGVWIGFEPPSRLNLDLNLSCISYIIMFMIYSLLIVTCNRFSKYVKNNFLMLSAQIYAFKKRRFIKLWKVASLVLFGGMLIYAVLNNIYFATFTFSSFPHFQDRSESILRYEASFIDKQDRENIRLILSNSFLHLRVYIDDLTFTKDFLVPPPDSEEDFLRFIRKGFNNSIIVITDNPYISSFEYANKYIKKYSLNSQTIIPYASEPPLLRSNITNIVLNLKFNEGKGKEIYDSRNNYVGAVYGATWVDRLEGTALRFNGITDYVEILTNQDLTTLKEITIKTWIMPENVTGKHVILMRGEPGANKTNFHLRIDDGEILFAWNLLGWNVFRTKGAQLIANKWFHIVVRHVFGDANSTRIYVNGQLIPGFWIFGNGSLPAPEINCPLHIGAQPLFSGYEFYFKGIIDEISIYNRALNENEVQMFYSEGIATPIYKEKFPKGNIVIYKVVGNIKLHNTQSEVIVEEAKVFTINLTHIALKLKVFSSVEKDITILIGTNLFLKTLNAQLKVGENYFEYIFRARNAESYNARYLVSSRILIVDNQGAIIFNATISKFQLKSFYLILFIVIVGVVLFFYMFLALGTALY